MNLDAPKKNIDKPGNHIDRSFISRDKDKRRENTKIVKTRCLGGLIITNKDPTAAPAKMSASKMPKYQTFLPSYSYWNPRSSAIGFLSLEMTPIR